MRETHTSLTHKVTTTTQMSMNRINIFYHGNMGEKRNLNPLFHGRQKIINLVLEDIWVLVFCCEFQRFLLLHVAVSSQYTQVAPIECQQHHGGGESPIPIVSQALSSNHGDPGEGRLTVLENDVGRMVEFSTLKV